MGFLDYFKKAKREREGFFIEFKDEELKRFNRYRAYWLIFLILALVLIQTIIGTIVFGILALIFVTKMASLRSMVYKRYLTKKHKK